MRQGSSPKHGDTTYKPHRCKGIISKSQKTKDKHRGLGIISQLTTHNRDRLGASHNNMKICAKFGAFITECTIGRLSSSTKTLIRLVNFLKQLCVKCGCPRHARSIGALFFSVSWLTLGCHSSVYMLCRLRWWIFISVKIWQQEVSSSKVKRRVLSWCHWHSVSIIVRRTIAA